MNPKRSCTGTTKHGNPCKARPLKNHDVCLAHADQATRASMNFQQGPRPGRPRIPKPTEVARRLVEENIVAVQRPYWRALGYDVVIGLDGPRLVEMDNGGVKLFGTSHGGQVNVSSHDDLGAMMAAAEKLQDRAFGRPKQTSEITGLEGGPLQVQAPLDAPARSKEAAALLASLHAAPLTANGNGNGNGSGNGHGPE